MNHVRAAVLAMGVAMALGAAFAEEPADAKSTGAGGYTALRLDEAGVFVGGFNGRIDSMSDGVRITLLSDDPSKPPLPISANQMKFSWPENGGKRPSRILLEGKVYIKHPQAEIRAEKADWDFDNGTLTFTGNPVMKNDQAPQGLEAQKIILDFSKNRYQVFGGHADMIPFGAGEDKPAKPESTSLLTADDVRDWNALFTKLAAAAKSEDPSPGRQLYSLLNPKFQKAVASMTAEELVKEKDTAAKEINRVLMHPKFYDETAWRGVDVGAEAKALLAKGKCSADEQMRLNRLLLEAAFPGVFAPPQAATN